MIYLQYQLPIFVIALIANVALVTVVIQYAPKNSSRTLFCLFAIAQMLWITVNFFAFQVPIEYFLFVSRLTMFFAISHAVLFYLFVDNFLAKHPVKMSRVIPISVFGSAVAVTTLTSLVFSRLGPDSNGTLAPQTGPLIPLFGTFVGFCILAAFTKMVLGFRNSLGEEKQQWKFLTWGFVLTFILVLLFSFLNFVFLRNLTGVQFGHLYTLPFVAFTSYAMIKHKLLNVKSVLAEIMVVVLNAIIFLQLINSQTTPQFLVSGLVLVGTLIVGIQLIRGVEKEVKQRQQLEILTKQLELANEKLKTLDKARAEFISIASHQLRTPPSTIKWYLSAILSGDYGKVPKNLEEQLKKTKQTNDHLISLIEDMLNVSRIERGKMEFLFEPTNVEELAQFAFEQLVPIAKDKKLEFKYQPPASPLPGIMADKEKLRQVMNNIIDNALKYTKAGFVKVELSGTADQIIFKVQDSGKGVNAEEVGNIFQKYTRGKESVKQSAGLGLGLYVAQVIINQHKGKLWVESSGEGKGSTFLFSIPINNGLKQTTLVDLGQTAGK